MNTLIYVEFSFTLVYQTKKQWTKEKESGEGKEEGEGKTTREGNNSHVALKTRKNPHEVKK